MSEARLYIVSTPIGNLEDFSRRAERILHEVSLIAAEDTRHSRRLLDHFGIATPMQAVHEHNESQVVPSLIARLQAGESMALISDAGTPLISDPGFVLVRAARQAGIGVTAVPGASALLSALAVAGLPTDRFVFEGFLPAKQKARQERLAALKSESRTLVLYESNHRIAACAADIAEIFGAERQVCVARELTKLHEESALLPAVELPAWVAADGHRQRGEFVLVIGGAPAEVASAAGAESLLRQLLAELPTGKAARLAAQITGQPRKQLYQLALEIKPDDSSME